MYYSATALQPKLLPMDYCSPEVFQREREFLLKTWQFVGLVEQLKNTGDFLTTEVLGVPIQVRRFNEGIVALSNVCAHRHCLISSKKCGHTAEMACQYHGWEYGADGYTRKIPKAKDFAPIQREDYRINRFSIAEVGGLLFVKLKPSETSIQSQLGSVFDLLVDRTSKESRVYLDLTKQYSANWKVAVENSLEAYHVEAVHPKTFRSDPGESRSEHILGVNHTSFSTDLPFAHSRIDLAFQRSQKQVMRLVNPSVRITGMYCHHHVFPNMMISFTDAILLLQSVNPIESGESISRFIQFGHLPARRGPRRWLARAWGKLEAWCTKQILLEDVQLLPAIQRGLESSSHRGVLARSEERIHAFQSYLKSGIDSGS